MTLTFTTQLKEAVVKKARATFGERKGAISTWVEMVLRNELHLNVPNVEET